MICVQGAGPGYVCKVTFIWIVENGYLDVLWKSDFPYYCLYYLSKEHRPADSSWLLEMNLMCHIVQISRRHPTAPKEREQEFLRYMVLLNNW